MPEYGCRAIPIAQRDNAPLIDWLSNAVAKAGIEDHVDCALGKILCVIWRCYVFRPLNGWPVAAAAQSSFDAPEAIESQHSSRTSFRCASVEPAI